MPKSEPSPYDNVEAMANSVLQIAKGIERNDFKVNQQDLMNFVRLTQITTTMLKASVSDMKSKDALIKGYINLLPK